MRLLTDIRYDYPGYPGSKAHCRIRIYGGDPDRPTVVIATEAEDNTGTSITNAAESLATQVRREFNLDPDTILWVEHYRDRAFFGGRPSSRGGSPWSRSTGPPTAPSTIPNGGP